MSNKLENKIALITGAGRGIGQAIACKLASEGANLVINDLTEEPALETKKLVEDMGRECEIVVGDVTAPDFGDNFIKVAVDRFGTIDIIVNNAGYAWDAIIQKMTDEQFQAMMDVHVTAPFRILRAASEVIRPAAKAENEAGTPVHRKVVNISSISGLYGNPGQIAYSSAKAALIGMTRTMCKEWGRYNVNVNCVTFGFIKTRMTGELGSPETKAQIGDREITMGIHPDMAKGMESIIPLGRGATPEEAADAVYLFCIPESNYISGQIVLAGGGLII
ncbi:MAG: SDR family oxidoreductase [Rhodospirillaceae bacterium]|nr:SDR family oxidoreductase [Rhodospirillaceae bacterium]MBT4940097.1 SDR family oxidoreductase [Rhodospirillaceae bacterium]MBT5941959.1 SDR family oxidoreductase [Rhodospirillaceae bacterium]